MITTRKDNVGHIKEVTIDNRKFAMPQEFQAMVGHLASQEPVMDSQLVHSHTSQRVYQVASHPSGVRTCTCPGFYYRGYCSHLNEATAL